MTDQTAARGLTPRELARLWRVSPERVRSWIQTGQLGALDTAAVRCRRPRYVILPRHVEAFEAARRAATSQQPVQRRRRQSVMTDYYPD